MIPNLKVFFWLNPSHFCLSSSWWLTAPPKVSASEGFLITIIPNHSLLLVREQHWKVGGEHWKVRGGSLATWAIHFSWPCFRSFESSQWQNNIGKLHLARPERGIPTTKILEVTMQKNPLQRNIQRLIWTFVGVSLLPVTVAGLCKEHFGLRALQHFLQKEIPYWRYWWLASWARGQAWDIYTNLEEEQKL